MKKRMWSKAVSIFTAILLVVGFVPNMTVAVMAAEEIKLFIGGQQITESGCYENQNGTWTKVDGTEPANGQFSYDAATFTLTLNEAEITNNHTVNVAEGYTYDGSVIAFSQTADVSLKIVVSQGTSTITGNGGIRVESTTGNASLSIKGSGSLEVEPKGSNSGITLCSSKNTNLDIDGADVTASSPAQYGVYLISSTDASSTSTITVNNGSLTTGGNGNVGIYYYWSGTNNAGTSSLTVSGNAVVDTRNSQIMAQNKETVVQVGAGSDGNGGIVFNGKSGTVYGDVTLDESITINQDETLRIPNGSSLNSNNHLTNNGTIIVENGGVLTGETDGKVVYAPSITTESLPEGKVNEEYSTSLSADGSEPIEWSVTQEDSLPTGLSLSKDGKITGIPTALGDYVFTVTASNAAGSVSKELTITVKDSIYSIHNSGDISFADTLEGYTPEVKTIMITNDGNQPITLDQPSSTSFDVGSLSKAELNAGETAEFTVQPKTGLLAGVYDEDIVVTGNSNGQSVTTTVNVKFYVKHNAVKVERKDPTCTENGNIEYWYCEACRKYFQDEALTKELKQEETIIKAKGHNAVKTEEKLATCTEDGNIEYWYCDVCKKYFSDAELKNEISFDKTVIPTTGHNLIKIEAKDPTCTENGNIEYWYCEACRKYFQDEALTKELKQEETIIKAKGHNAVKTEEKLATCTEDGNIEYWYCDVCKKYFSDAELKNEISFDKTVIPTTGHNLIKIEAKDPTIDGTGNIEYWYCEVCDKYFSDEKAGHEITLEDTVIAKLPKLVSGANQEWTKRSKEGLTFKVDTDINEFKKVLVDGKELKDTDYDIKSGSTIVTLKSSFLDTLSAGKHQIRLEFNNGTIEAYFTVKVKETTTVPETGEQTNLYLWAMLAIASSASILVLRRYKKYNR